MSSIFTYKKYFSRVIKVNEIKKEAFLEHLFFFSFYIINAFQS